MEFISEEVRKYATAHSTAEPETLAAINRETHVNVLFPRMLSGHFQGRLLSMYSKMIHPSHILEIGTYTGYGTICLAEGLRENGMIHTIEINTELEDIIKQNLERAGISDRVILHFSNALEILPSLDLDFDIVFLDADKIGYLSYYKLLMEKLKPGSFIFADNVLWSGKVIDNSDNDKEAHSLQEFNDYVQKDERTENILLPVRDGLMIIRKK